MPKIFTIHNSLHKKLPIYTFFVNRSHTDYNMFLPKFPKGKITT